MALFTEYVPDPTVRFQIGWFYLEFLGLIMFANVLAVAVNILIGAKKEK
jgi:hypothetical protein